MEVFCIFANMIIGILILVLLLALFIYVGIKTVTDTPHPFECGSDEVCHCDVSISCIKNESKEE